MTQSQQTSRPLPTNPAAYDTAVAKALDTAAKAAKAMPDSMTVFGVNGPAGSGKTTLFHSLQNRYGTPVVYASPSRATFEAVKPHCDWLTDWTYDEIKSRPYGRETLIALWRSTDTLGDGSAPIRFALSAAARHPDYKDSSIVLYDSIGREAELLTLACMVRRLTCLCLKATVHGVKPALKYAADSLEPHWEGDSRSPIQLPKGAPGNVTILSAHNVRDFNRSFTRGWARLEPIVRGIHLIRG